VVILSIFAVNFRHILYSAAITPFMAHFTLPQKLASFFLLTDPQFAETVTRGESRQRVSFSWYMGFGLTIYAGWVALSFVGAYFGRAMGDPKAWGFDVLLPIYFLGIVLGFRKRDNFLGIALVSAVASVLAFHYVGSPWHVSLGALAGVLLAAALPPKPALSTAPKIAEAGE